MNALTNRISTRRLFLSFTAILLAAVAAQASVEEGWQHLLANRPIEAEKAFLASVDTPEGHDALEGLVLSKWLLGDAPGMYETWMRLLQTADEDGNSGRPWWPGYFTGLQYPALQGGDPRVKLEACRIVHSLRHLSDRQRHIALENIAALEERLGEENVEEDLARLGVVRDWWYVAGPFGLAGAGDLQVTFPPEVDLWAEKWSGWLGEVKPIPLYVEGEAPMPADRCGWLDFGQLTRREGDVAYAVTVLEGTRVGKARLLVETSCDVRVWWDGQGVLERDRQRHDTASVYETEVPVRRGPILVVIKAKTDRNWRLRVRVDDPEGVDPPWTLASRSETSTEGLAIEPFESTEGGETSSEEPAVTRGMDTPTLPDVPQAELLKSIYDTLGAIQSARIPEARSELLKLRGVCEKLNAAAWALPDLLEANLNLVESRARPNSSTRLLQQAQRAFEKARAGCPLAVDATVGLCSYYIRRDQIEEALEQAEAFVSETWEPTGRPLPSTLDETLANLYNRKGWRLRARNRYVAVHEGNWPSDSGLYDQLVSHAQSMGRSGEALDWLLRGLERFPRSGRLFNRLASLPAGLLSGNKAAAKAIAEILETQQRLHPNDPNWRRRAVHLARLRGDLEGGLEVARRAVQELPHSSELKELLANFQAVAQPEQVQENRAAYRAALDVAPWRDNLRRALQVLPVADGETSAVSKMEDPFGPFDVQLDDLDLSEAERWQESRAGSVFLIDIVALELQPEGTYREYIHQAVRILNEQGRRAWAEHVIPSGVDLRMARTIAPDGTSWPVDHIRALNGQQALSFFEVREGSIVEYAYTRTVSWNLAPGRNTYTRKNYFGAIEEPMLLSKLVVLAPPGVDPIAVWGEKSLPVERQTLESGLTAYVWESRGQEPVKSESYMPPVDRLVPTVQVTTASSWQPPVTELLALLQGAREPGPWIGELLTEIALPEKIGDRQRIAKIVAWVHEEIQAGSGNGTALDTAVLRSGSNISKLMLLEALIREAGYEAIPARMLPLSIDRAGNTPDGFGPFPGNGLGGALLLRVTLPDEDGRVAYLDPSARYAEPFYLQPGYQSSVALVLDSKGYYAEPVSPERWQGGWIETRLNLRLDPDRSAAVTGSLRFEGPYRQLLVQLAKNAESKERFVRQQAGNAVRGLVVDLASLEDAENPTGRPHLVLRGSLPEHQRGADVREVDLCPSPSELAQSLIQEVTRATPMTIGSAVAHQPLEILYDLKPLLTEGAWNPEIPQDALLLDRFGVFTLTARLEGAVLRVRRSLLLPPQEIDARLYGEFAEFCRRVDESERAILRLRPIGSLP